MRAIFTRDFLSFFRKYTGGVFFAVYFVLCGIVFADVNIIGGSGSPDTLFKAVSVFSALGVPLLTFGLFIEGRELNVEQTLYVSPFRAVISKFAAVMAMELGAILSMWIYIGIMAIFIKPYYSEILMSQIGILLLSGCVCGISMFVITISHRRMQAFIMIYTVIALFFVADDIIYMSEFVNIGVKTNLFELFQAFREFRTGMLSAASLSYMLVFILITLLLAAMMLDRKKEKGLRHEE